MTVNEKKENSMSISMAIFLHDVHPIKAFRCVPKEGRDYEIYDCEVVPDLKSLDGVVDQGFDPCGVCGPTYWRVTASHYYSTVLTEKGVVLLITRLPNGLASSAG